MDLKLEGKTALVTGGSAGIGLAIVKALTAEGVTVSVPGRNRENWTRHSAESAVFGQSLPTQAQPKGLRR